MKIVVEIVGGSRKDLKTVSLCQSFDAHGILLDREFKEFQKIQH